MKLNRPVPESIKEAKRFSKRFDIAFTALCLSILPLLWVGKAIHFSPDSVVWIYFSLLAVAGLLTPWRKVSANRTLVREFERQQAREVLTNTLPGSSFADDNPLSALAERVHALASGDEKLLELVETVIDRLGRSSRDVASLEAAVAAERQVVRDEDDARIERLIAVLERRKHQEDKLTQALRDLHVELTIREDDSHDVLFTEVNDLLASLSAENEVDETSQDPEIERRRRQQAQAAQRDPSHRG